MLAKRIIPCLDVKDGRVVKGVNFVSLRDAGDIVENAKFYNEEGADEVTFLDITATCDGRKTFAYQVEKAAKELFVPLTVGGGITSVEDFRTMLLAGADKVAVNSAAIKDKYLIQRAAEKFGAQCVVCAVDAKKVDDGYHVFIHGGRVDTGLDAISWIEEAVSLGAGEILLTSMDMDGTKAGFENNLVSLASKAVNVPIIASGGGGSMQDFYDTFEAGADAALAATLFHFRELPIGELKKYLRDRGIAVRI